MSNTNIEQVCYLGAPNAKTKILILGNSITLHESNYDIGWFGEWGMAASTFEKDYVHLLYRLIRKGGKEVLMRVKKCVFWELGLKENNILEKFNTDKDFLPDIIVFRLGENVPIEDEPYFKSAIAKLIDYIRPKGCKVVFTTCFWQNPRDKIIAEVAKKYGASCANIGGDESLKALGKFKNDAVANHPGDLGMQMIAEKIYEILKVEINN